uniref:Secreted protein n=1 Tax=Steinernema glaseri TaxID=37863 RepID=A0A1I7ZSB6_9BILA
MRQVLVAFLLFVTGECYMPVWPNRGAEFAVTRALPSPTAARKTTTVPPITTYPRPPLLPCPQLVPALWDNLSRKGRLSLKSFTVRGMFTT